MAGTKQAIVLTYTCVRGTSSRVTQEQYDLSEHTTINALSNALDK